MSDLQIRTAMQRVERRDRIEQLEAQVRMLRDREGRLKHDLANKKHLIGMLNEENVEQGEEIEQLRQQNERLHEIITELQSRMLQLQVAPLIVAEESHSGR